MGDRLVELHTPVRCRRPKQAFDDESYPKGGDQVTHHFALGCAPPGLEKYLKNSLSGDSSILVSLPFMPAS